MCINNRLGSRLIIVRLVVLLLIHLRQLLTTFILLLTHGFSLSLLKTLIAVDILLPTHLKLRHQVQL